jgi:molybdopterin-guanine dinucleotide biosynthesis protein A
VAAIVLAGGKSSRMGQDKALIAIQGKALLQRVCEVALQCITPVYVVSPRTEQYRAVVPNDCQWIQEQCNPAATTPHGPLIGFAQALAQVQVDWVLLLACDLPLLRSEILQTWIEQLAEIDDGELIAVLSKSEQQWEPLCGFYHRRCLPSLTSAIEQGERSFQGWLVNQPVQELVVRDRQILFNCNTPDDLALFLTLLQNTD